MKPATLLFLLFAAAASARAGDLFAHDSVLDLVIDGPFEDLIAAGDEEERPFVLSVDGSELDVKIRRRGKSRLRVCKFPPLRLNFVKKQTDGTAFAGENKLKLVTHCKDSERAEQDLLEEYLAYRLFNIVTNASYRVRLAQLRYINADGSEQAHRYGFIIESSAGFAARLGATSESLPHLKLSSLDKMQASLMYVFQYMIGNTDWSLVKADLADDCCHNIELFERDQRLLTVPYDFDLVGLVNASYARPDPSIGNRTVKTRRYRGYCVSADALTEALLAIQSARSELLATVSTVPGLQPENVQRAEKYLDQFFDDVEDETRTVRKFERACL